MTRTGNEHNY
jgi:hypothetical protein